ncbi:MAG TPA: carbonic anhydrase family protein [Terriglobales bacterium]
MFGNPGYRLLLLAVCGLYFSVFAHAAPGGACQVAEPAEKPEQHQHGHSMEMNIPSGVTDKCAAKFTYDDGPLGPSHWESVCNAGHTQAPIDITKSEKITVPPLAPLQMSYQPADLDMVNDCNHYLIKLRFPSNQWLKVARKPYRLSEIEFHEPGEIAVNGKRPLMSLQLVHLSPELSFLIIEVPIVVGKENPLIKTLWKHIPAGGKENKVANVKINAMDLLPADHGFYFFRGSLTHPPCNEGVMWYLMKSPIEMSEAQIAQFKTYYHNTARPLQPLNNRPVVESKETRP